MTWMIGTATHDLRHGRLARRLILAAALGASAVGAAGMAQAQEALSPGLITVTGEGEVTAAPDMADVTIGVVADAATAAAALQANSQALTTVIDGLKKDGIESRDLQTSGLSLEPRYEPMRNNQPPKLAGYRASNTVTVRVRDLSKLGTLLDKSVGSGANELRGLSFGLANHAVLQDDARRRALLDAMRKAQLYAETGGVKLGALRAVTEEAFGFPVPKFAQPRMAMAADAAPPVPIEGGELSVKARVQVTYAIAP
jgi:uncharacterized protein YggE